MDDKIMWLRSIIEKIERDHFRTNYDTGANVCALLVWNQIREAAKLPELTKRDLAQRYYRDTIVQIGRATVRGDAEAVEHYRRVAISLEKDMG